MTEGGPKNEYELTGLFPTACKALQLIKENQKYKQEQERIMRDWVSKAFYDVVTQSLQKDIEQSTNSLFFKATYDVDGMNGPYINDDMQEEAGGDLESKFSDFLQTLGYRSISIIYYFNRNELSIYFEYE